MSCVVVLLHLWPCDVKLSSSCVVPGPVTQAVTSKTLLASAQALELIPARTGKVVVRQYLCCKPSILDYTPRDTVSNTSITSVINTCRSVKSTFAGLSALYELSTDTLVIYKYRFPYLSSSDSVSRSLLTLLVLSPFADKIKKSAIVSRSLPIHSR
ncbi:hypothetical protein BGY98DRAFT_984772 [Russula aff. rugulosa BPL654]|nr:hypothetical protein BGY98DRAFT_984772 [Russula aff. rugulosa BPL654]